MNTATVSMAVTPTVLSTFLSHYLNRKPLQQRPTAHLSYDEGLHLIRSFLAFASHHTVEDLQAFTSQWVPHPQWVKVDEIEISKEKLDESAQLLQTQLGPDGIRKVGGRNWWQWRKPESPLKAEWIEMRSDYNERKRLDDPGKRIMLYVHGGAYFFGSVDEHRYQMQRHARKLKARVFAPKYRLSPQFPFPCGLQDCIAAYLHLLRIHDPSTIILAGDSAGGGMVLSMLVILRDRGIPLPAGAILISPWVDLTHSFPSVAGDAPLDYIPSCGFHHKPSKAWPPLNADEYRELKEQIAKKIEPGQTKLIKPASVLMKRKSQEMLQLSKDLDDGLPIEGRAETKFLSINIDGKDVVLKDQIQMYATNELLSHPLVSPALQPTLGGLPPLLIMTGGGEILRDEQIYVAHKCAAPQRYPPGDEYLTESARAQIARFKPTDVQLQVWDDLCHVAPTLSFTRPAKFMYRSVAQFGAWVLARAQKTDIEILDDDDISFISSSESGSDSDGPNTAGKGEVGSSTENQPLVGKAGDPLPPFENHMIRQSVSRHGIIRDLASSADLPACNLDPNEVGIIKEGPVRKWLEACSHWDSRYGSARARIHKIRLKEMAAGYEGFDGELPPPSALASRRRTGEDAPDKKKTKSMGLALWSLWGSKHDETTINREQDADKAPETKIANNDEGEEARSTTDLSKQAKKISRKNPVLSRSRSKTKIVRDEQQVSNKEDVDENTPASVFLARREGKASEQTDAVPPIPGSNLLTPDYVPPETGVMGKRPTVGGMAVPFSLNKEADTASMITLSSNVEQPSRVASPRPMSNHLGDAPTTSASAAAQATEKSTRTNAGVEAGEGDRAPVAQTPGAGSLLENSTEETDGTETPKANSPEPTASPLAEHDVGNGMHGKEPTTPMIVIDKDDGATPSLERPGLETFVTAQEDLPRAR